jgi:hypothetical protein
MAIKPDDCVIRLKDLEIGTDTVSDRFGRPQEVSVYEPYWANFLSHVKETTDWKSGGWNEYDINFEKQLAKFNAVFKNTKKYDERYVKFKSHKDLTFFMLRWS